MNMKTATFATKISIWQSASQLPDRASERPGACQPPRKRVTKSAEEVIMLMYSAVKNMENFMDEYSVWYPATSSDSASGRSKGARFVSAYDPTRKISAPSGLMKMFHA